MAPKARSAVTPPRYMKSTSPWRGRPFPPVTGSWRKPSFSTPSITIASSTTAPTRGPKVRRCSKPTARTARTMTGGRDVTAATRDRGESRQETASRPEPARTLAGQPTPQLTPQLTPGAPIAVAAEVERATEQVEVTQAAPAPAAEPAPVPAGEDGASRPRRGRPRRKPTDGAASSTASSEAPPRRARPRRAAAAPAAAESSPSPVKDEAADDDTPPDGTGA